MSSDLKTLALKLAHNGPHKVLPTPRLVQLLHNGAYIVKTTKAVFVWEHPYYPQFYIPQDEFMQKEDVWIEYGDDFTNEQGKVVATQWIVYAGQGDVKIDKIIRFHDSVKGLGGLVRVEFGEVDQWFEESTPIFIHPKDPFKRIDILHSTRHLIIRVGGVQVAETSSSMHLYETGLPVRFYIPRTSIDPAVLKPSKKGTRTKCPYKGDADYFDVVLKDGQVFEDVVWYYDRPIMESAKIEGLCCFYNEKVEIELDGEMLETPVTHFSNKEPNKKPSVV